MKLSLAWIFDHIDADWKKQDVQNIMRLFNQTTAEIECFYSVSFDISHFFLAVPKSAGSFSIPELGKEITLKDRQADGALSSNHVLAFIVKKEGDKFVWANQTDFGAEKDALIPAVQVTEAQLKGSWRQDFEPNDVILEVDNKSITHRPDMWGHRGFAREIAAFLKLPLKPKDKFLANVPVTNFDKISKPTASTPIVTENEVTSTCPRFTSLYFSSIQSPPCNLLVVSRLLKIGSRPIGGLVDLTNYVMNDWAQPVHAYDAKKIGSDKFIIRMAKEGEKLLLLDGNEITLTPQDMVTSTPQRALTLGGVKGGMDSGLGGTTTAMFFEAGNWDAGFVRRTAQRHKTRTDASARYEKTMDPNQTIEGIQRFVKLLQEFGVANIHAQEIISIGHDVTSPVIEVSHAFLENRMGVKLTEQQVVDLLTPLEFKVQKSHDSAKNVIYLVSVPTFRSSKDIKIKEDILEEVTRTYGFDKIPLQLPHIVREPFNFTAVSRLRSIKAYFANGAKMTEQQNYSLMDESFINSLGLKIEVPVALVNPISENYYRMTPSLIPGLLKNIKENHTHHEQLAFFECGRIWPASGKAMVDPSLERKSVAGIIFKKRAVVDFYQGKDSIVKFFHELGFGLTEWNQSKQHDAWFQEYQTATLKIQDKVVGMAGKIDPVLLTKLDIDAPCDAFAFELDGDYLLTHQQPVVKFKPLSKYQDTFVDLSLMVPMTVHTQAVLHKLNGIDSLITKIDLIDFFEKSEWHDVRAQTFRVWLVSDERTLGKADIDAVWQKAVDSVQALGCKVRM